LKILFGNVSSFNKPWLRYMLPSRVHDNIIILCLLGLRQRTIDMINILTPTKEK
jgi:hypothetical protein